MDKPDRLVQDYERANPSGRLDQAHLEIEQLGNGLAAHNRISGAVCFLPHHTVGGPKQTTNLFDSLLSEDLAAAGLFIKSRHVHPVPVSFSKSSRFVSLFCSRGERTAILECPNDEILDIFKFMLGKRITCEREPEGYADRISLQYHGDGFGVFVNSTPVFGQCEFPMARHVVMREIATSLAGRHRVSATFHAGAVGTNEKALVFAAPSGSGKSTLTAAAAVSGFTYLSDDQCAFVDGLISPFPTRIGLKAGSWDVADLHSYDLDSIEPSFVGDGYTKAVTPPVAADSSDLFRVAAFVFPAFDKIGSYSLVEVTKMEALQRLFDSGARLTGRYPTFRPLAETLAEVPAYSLTYNNTLQAIEAVADLLAA
ncbi:MAG: hypothetical protein AAF724_10560 [Pseudomonadota bacterium]